MKEHTKPTITILSFALAFCIIACGPVYGGSTTIIEEIDTGSMFYDPSIAIGNNDVLNICYEDSSGNLIYASRIDNVWDKSVIENFVGKSFTTSLGMDNGGNPHISYAVEDVGLKYAVRTGTEWTIKVIDNGSHASSSLAVDSEGFPHIGYNDWANNSLKYVRWTGNSWQIETVETFDNDTNILYNKIDIDSENNPHIVYSYQIGWLPEADMVIRYAQRETDVWTIETISHHLNLFPNSYRLAPNNTPSILLSGPSAELYFAFKTDNGWQVELVPSTLSLMSVDSLAFNSKNEPILCYFDPENRTINVAKRTGDGWHITEVYNSKSLGQWVGLYHVLDSKDNHHILLEDAVNFELIYLQVSSSVSNTFPTTYIAIIALVAIAAIVAVAVLHHRKKKSMIGPQPGPEEIGREEEHEG